MKHLEDEDIARLIDGNISKKEQVDFMKHLSQCTTCLNIYTESLDFMEDHKKYPVTQLPAWIKTTLNRLQDSLNGLFKNHLPKLAFAAALLVLMVSVPFILDKITDNRILTDKVTHIDERFTQGNIQALNPDSNAMNIAVRTGIFVEDLLLLAQTPAKEEAETTLIWILKEDLKRLENNTQGLIEKLEKIDKNNIAGLVNEIGDLMKRQSLLDLFQLGRFLEGSLLSTFADKQPDPDQVANSIHIAQKHGLLKSVLDGLNELQSLTAVEKIRACCIKIEAIFFE
jgi:hypothetical protein